MVTTKDIAKVVGVSHTTVSRALNDHFHTSDKMKRKVRKVAKQLGYVPNAIAKGLNQKRTQTLGLVFPYSLTDPFLARVYHGIEEETLKSGYNMFICRTNDDQKREQLQLNQLQEKRVDGVIMVPASGNFIDDSALRETVASFRQLEIPVVFIDKYLFDLDVNYVVPDYERNAYELTTYLIDLGHRRIGFLGGYDCSSTREKQRGYRRALENAGVAYEEGLVKNADLKSDMPSKKWADCVIHDLLADDGLTAVLVNIQQHTQMVLQAWHNQPGAGKLDVADFASLADEDRFLLPTATAMMDLEEMGRVAAEIIMKYQKGGERTKRQGVVLPSELIFRKAVSGCAASRGNQERS